MRALLAKTIVAAAAALALAGCPDPNPNPDGGQGDAGTDQCAASNFTTVGEQLLNAPVAQGVVVVKKTPNHPPLDGGLP